MPNNAYEHEWRTRKTRIDPRLKAAGWPLNRITSRPITSVCRSEEEDTSNGPADYALWLDSQIAAIVEGKKVATSTQEVLKQAGRYSRGLRNSAFSCDGFRCPFLYSTNGEIIWFRDVRNPLNLQRRLAAFHTPDALREFLARDFDGACTKLRELPNDKSYLRPYQRDANAAVEAVIAARKRSLLVAMATGTGKTYTMVNQVYRLMKSGVAKRVLFLVDRRALAAQAVRAFAAYDAEPGLKFNHVYEVYSSRFQTGDFDDGAPFDPKVLPNSHLTNPKIGDAFVYVATIQRMAINVLGRQAIFGARDESIDDDAQKLDIPIHAFDLIIADECHRGYSSQELSVWRETLDHFDAIKVGLTATPAAHTTAYFTQKAFSYTYEQAVREEYLVDYDVINIKSDVRLKGVFLKEGEQVENVDPETGQTKLDLLEDERNFDTSEVERTVTAPESNRKILEEIDKHAKAHEQKTGRFPKILIFAVNDLPHTSHADQLVALSREIFGRGNDFVSKITGRVDRPLQAIREFRNRPNPGVAVTVDLLTTGVDIPDLEFLVFARPVKSRILFEQMLGRGTRLGEKYKDKSHFVVFDCFNGTLLEYFKGVTGISQELPAPPSRTISHIVNDIWANRDREYNVRCLVKRLQRIDKEMSGEARDLFAVFVADGDVGRYARELATRLRTDFVREMSILRDGEFLRLCVSYPRAPRAFTIAPTYQDTVTSERLIRGVDGSTYKPEDYLEQFSQYVTENEDRIDAIKILLDRPRDWSEAALKELRDKLSRSKYRFTSDRLLKAHELAYGKALVDIISMVKHAANEQLPLFTCKERVDGAIRRVTQGLSLSPEEDKWVERIRRHLEENLSIQPDHFELDPVLADGGGWRAARRVFGEKRLTDLVTNLNEAIAA